MALKEEVVQTFVKSFPIRRVISTKKMWKIFESIAMPFIEEGVVLHYLRVMRLEAI